MPSAILGKRRQPKQREMKYDSLEKQGERASHGVTLREMTWPKATPGHEEEGRAEGEKCLLYVDVTLYIL